MKKIYILWLRQIKKYLRSKSRMLGSLAQPILYLFALGYGFGTVFQEAGQGNYINFLAPGVISMSILFTSIFSRMEVIWDRQFGFLKETLVAPISRLDIVIGRTLGGATVSTLQGVMVMAIALLLGFQPNNWFALIPAIAIMFLIAVLFTAMGTMLASIFEDMQAFHLVINFLVMPLFFLSGALFPLQGVPLIIEIIARINPLSYGVDAIRYLVTGQTYYGLHLDLLVLSGVTLLSLWLGSYFFKKIQI